MIMLLYGLYLYFRYKRYNHKIEFGEIVVKNQFKKEYYTYSNLAYSLVL